MTITSNLPKILKARGFENPHQFSISSGINPATAARAMYDPHWIPQGPVLDKLCRFLDLQPGDFLIYQKEENDRK